MNWKEEGGLEIVRRSSAARESLDALSRCDKKWATQGLCSQPARRDIAEDALRALCGAACLRPPEVIIWCGSPFAGAWEVVLWSMLGGRLDALLRSYAIIAEVASHCRREIKARVGGREYAHIRYELGHREVSRVSACKEQVIEMVTRRSLPPRLVRLCKVPGHDVEHGHGGKGPSIDPEVLRYWDLAGKLPRQHTRYGQDDTAHMALFDYFRMEFSADAAMQRAIKPVAPLLELAESAGWFWVEDGVAWVCERPVARHLDGHAKLHCEDGPALLYPDGQSVWCWHGTELPAQAILHPEIAKAAIGAEKDPQTRRALIARYGTLRYLEEVGARVVSSDEWGTLYRSEKTGCEPYVVLRIIRDADSSAWSVLESSEAEGEESDVFAPIANHCRSVSEAFSWLGSQGTHVSRRIQR